jgi:putative tryptophan/tyrosine transport system substrate-binding protein
MLDVRRREFIALLGGVAAWPLAARAQHSAMPVIGFLNPGSSEPYANLVAAFRRGLKETGYVEGQNVSIEYRWADGQYDRLSAMAEDLVSRRVTVIAATGGMFSGLAAKKATSTIPIVVIGTGDPVALGLVASLNRPGGNVTGVAMLGIELLAKRLELLRELVPDVLMIGVLVNPANPAAKVEVSNVEEAARSLGRQIVILNATNEGELNSAFASLIQQQIAALLIADDTFFINQCNRLAALTVRYAIAAIHHVREFAAAGGLMSYGTNFANAYRQMGIYVGRILKGAMPADLPVEQSTRFDLIINLTTAKALGLTIPDKLLAFADEVIE